MRILIELWLRPLCQGIIGTTAALLGIGLASAVGSTASGILGSKAASKAASDQSQTALQVAQLQSQDANKALDFQKSQYSDAVARMQPWLRTGSGATNVLDRLLGMSPSFLNSATPGTPSQTPPTPTPGSGGGSIADIIRSLRDGNGNPGGPGIAPNQASAMGVPQFGPGTPNGQSNGTQFNPPITSPGTSGTQFQMRPPIVSGGTQGSQFQMNPPITSGGTQGAQLGGVAGLLEANGQPRTEANPLPNGLGNLPQNVTTASTNQDGTGQVPRTDGGGNNLVLRPPSNLTGEAMFNPNDPSQGLPTDASGNTGGPNATASNGDTTGLPDGFLSQIWNKQFQAPTALDEQNDPGYQARLRLGSDTLERSAAARGNLLTGGEAKNLDQFAQDYASNEYGNVYNRAANTFSTNYDIFKQNQNDIFNRYATLAGYGQTAAGQLNNQGVATAGQVGNTLLTSGAQIGGDLNAAAAARGSGYVGSTNAITGAIGGGINSTMDLLAMYQAMQKGTPLGAA